MQGQKKSFYRVTKRLMDVAFAMMMLLITSPVLIVSSILVKLTSPGPVFYHALRAGKGGQPFEMYKFRTMYVGLDDVARRITEENDSRITNIGKYLRAFKIDELPQFWNVLVGEMSIVGPRPEDWEIVQRYYTEEQRRTLEVRPGITSLSAVIWYPDLTYHDPPPESVPIQEWYVQRHMPAQLAESLRYIDQRSILLDLKVMALTAFSVLVYSVVPPKKRPLHNGYVLPQEMKI